MYSPCRNCNALVNHDLEVCTNCGEELRDFALEFEASLKVPLAKLDKDLKEAAKTMSLLDARWIVDNYYDVQGRRIAAGHQEKRQKEQKEPHQFVNYVGLSNAKIEAVCKSGLNAFARTYRLGQWLQSIYGIGPVISAALMVTFDVRRGKHPDKFIRYAGMDPSCIWPSKDKVKEFVKKRAEEKEYSPEDFVADYFRIRKTAVSRKDLNRHSEAAAKILVKHGCAIPQTVVYTAARAENSAGKKVDFAAFCKDFDKHLAFYKALCKDYKVDSFDESKEISPTVIRQCCEKFGRNYFTTLHKLQYDKDGKRRKVDLEVLAKQLTRRPYNVFLKTLVTYKLGEVFVKYQARDECFYGILFAEKKEQCWDKNLDGGFSALAARELASKKIKKATIKYAWNSGKFSPATVREWMDLKEQYNQELKKWKIKKKAGIPKESLGPMPAEPPMTPEPAAKGEGMAMLSPEHIHNYARRWVMHLFVCHLHAAMHEDYYGVKGPPAWIFNKNNVEDHRHQIPAPGWPGKFGGKSLKHLYGEDEEK